VAAANLLEEAIVREGPDTVAAFIAEPARCRRRTCAARRLFGKRIRAICDQYDVLLTPHFSDHGLWVRALVRFRKHQYRAGTLQFKLLHAAAIPLGGDGVSDHDPRCDQQRAARSALMHAYTYLGHPTCQGRRAAQSGIIDEEELNRAAATTANSRNTSRKRAERASHVGAMCAGWHAVGR